MRQQAKAHGRMKLAALAVDAHPEKVLGPVMPEIAHIADAAGQLPVVGGNAPAFNGMEQLGGMEAERAYIAVIEHAAVVYSYPESMRGIVNNAQVMAFCNFLYAGHIAGNTVNVRGQNGGGAGGNGGFYFGRVNGKCLRVNVGENGGAAFPDQAACGGHVAEGGGYNLAAEAQGLNGNLQGNGTVVNVVKVFYAQVVFNFLLQLVNQGAVVGEVPALPYFAYECEVLLNIGQKAFGNGYQSSVKGE